MPDSIYFQQLGTRESHVTIQRMHFFAWTEPNGCKMDKGNVQTKQEYCRAYEYTLNKFI